MAFTPARSGRTRVVLAGGILLGCAALTTAAAFTDYGDSTVTFDGSRNSFDLVVSGSAEPGWTPPLNDWAQGNPTAYRITLTPDDSGYLMAPGSTLDLRVAVKNASPRLSGYLTLDITDPLPQGNAQNSITGTYLELFDQLVFTVSENGTVLADQVPASDLQRISWNSTLASGAVKILDVSITLPDTVDNRWQEAATDVQFHFEAENE